MLITKTFVSAMLNHDDTINVESWWHY